MWRTKDCSLGLKLDFACSTKKTHTHRCCFVSVISTGYKWYFLSLLTNVKLLYENYMNKSHLFRLVWACLTVAGFESFLCLVISFIYAKYMYVWTLCFSSSPASTLMLCMLKPHSWKWLAVQELPAGKNCIYWLGEREEHIWIWIVPMSVLFYLLADIGSKMSVEIKEGQS